MRSPIVPPTLQHRATQAAHDPTRGFTTLAQRIDEDVLHEACRHTRQSRAAGIDGVTAEMYAEPLDDNRRDLHERLRRGRYQAAPVERVWIEKDDGGQRPIGQPAVEDKIIQRAVARLLEAIDAQDFQDCSYGVRPGRSPPAARHAGRERGMPEGIGGSVEAAVRGYVDRSDRTRRREVRRQRVNAGRVWRRIGKWLRAGGMDNGVRHHPETDVGQGGVRSPGRAKVFRPQVLDEGFAREVRPRLKGRGCLSRVADDFCIGCEREADARQSMAVRPKRLARLGWTMHPEKTALIAFGKPDARQASANGNGTVECRGLTHDGAKSRPGCWVITRRPARKPLRRTTKSLWGGCRTHRPAPRQDPSRRRCLKWRGHCRVLAAGRRVAETAWRYGRSRRRRTRAMGGETCQRRLQP